MAAEVISIKGGRSKQPIGLHRIDSLPERPQREEIIKGLFAASEIVALTGPAGMGKSALATLMATCVADARPFLGRPVMSGPTIYVAAERYAEATRRLIAIQRRKAPVYITRARPNLSDRGEIDGLAEAILQICDHERSCPALIIFDTLARVMPGLDENSARDCGRVIENLTTLAELVPTAAIVFVHHTGKTSGEMRGSTALLAGVDLELRVEGGNKQRRLVASKANAVPEDQVLRFRLVPVEYRERPNADPESIITAEIDVPDGSNSHTSPSGSARLKGRARQLLELIETSAVPGIGVEKRDLLKRAREAEIFTGSADATRVACDRSIAELVAASEVRLADGWVHLGS
jgi:KaiC/GvpD/RAD55 family RecA-like ATPase